MQESKNIRNQIESSLDRVRQILNRLEEADLQEFGSLFQEQGNPDSFLHLAPKGLISVEWVRIRDILGLLILVRGLWSEQTHQRLNESSPENKSRSKFFRTLLEKHSDLSEIISELKMRIQKEHWIDLLGNLAIFIQQLFPHEVRKDLSMYFTGLQYANLAAVRLNILQEKKVRIFDPSSGGGVLLLAILEQLQKRNSEYPLDFNLYLVGNEIQPILAYFTTGVLWEAVHSLPARIQSKITVQVKEGDFFDLVTAADMPICDIIIMNPPYTNLERLPSTYVQKLKFLSEDHNLGRYTGGRGMSLHQFFLIHAGQLLREAGLLVAVIPESTINMVESRGSVQFLLDNFHIQRIYRSPIDVKMSSGVGVGEIVLIAQKSAKNPHLEPSQVQTPRLTQFIELLPMVYVQDARGHKSNGNTEKNEELVQEISPEILQATIGAWNQHFRVIPVLQHLQARAGDKLKPGASIFRSALEGKRPRGSDIFYLPNKFWMIIQDSPKQLEIALRDSPDTTLSIPKDLVRSALRSPRVDDGSLFPHIHHYFFLLSQSIGEDIFDLQSDVLAYFQWFLTNVRETIPASRLKPEKDEKRPWFLKFPFKDDIGASMAILEKFLPTSKAQCAQYLEPPCFPVGAYYYLLNDEFGEEDWQILTLWYNSTPGLLFRYKYRQVLGPGSERILAFHLEHAIPCLDPQGIAGKNRQRLLEKSAKMKSFRPLPSVKQQIGTASRKIMDTAILEVLGFESNEIGPILEDLKQSLIDWCCEIETRRQS